MSLGEERVLYCNVCGHTTQHDLHARYQYNEDDEREIFNCQICQTPQFRWANRNQNPPIELYFPSHDRRPAPPWSDELPADTAGLLRETLRAFADGHFWLVAMGSRTLIDMFALERIGDIGGFGAKLARLQAEGYLSERDSRIVKRALQVGHAATHRSARPSAEECAVALDVVEHLLQRTVLDTTARLSEIKGRRPSAPA